jgi:hypothetical protein
MLPQMRHSGGRGPAAVTAFAPAGVAARGGYICLKRLANVRLTGSTSA